MKKPRKIVKFTKFLSGKITLVYISHNDMVMKNANTVYELIKTEENGSLIKKLNNKRKF